MMFTLKTMNAMNHGIPQDRTRVIIVGFHKDEKIKKFEFPAPTHSVLINEEIQNTILSLEPVKTLKRLNWRPPQTTASNPKKKSNEWKMLKIPKNHADMTGEFSTIYMSRNRRRSWHQPSFTIQAGGRHAPLFPGSRRMVKVWRR